jgi:hypothetical protein
LSTGRWLYTFTFEGGKWGKTEFFFLSGLCIAI